MIINYQPSLSLYDLDSFVLAIGPWDHTATQVLEVGLLLRAPPERPVRKLRCCNTMVTILYNIIYIHTVTYIRMYDIMYVPIYVYIMYGFWKCLKMEHILEWQSMVHGGNDV